MLVDAFSLLVAKTSLIGLRLVLLYGFALTAGKAEFGQIALAFTIAEICRFVADWGTDVYSLRLFSHPSGRQATTYLAIFARLRGLACVFGWLLSAAAIFVLTQLETMAAVALIAMTTVTSLLVNISVNWCQARGGIQQPARTLATLSAIGSAILIYGSFVDWPPSSRLAALIAIEIGMAAVMVRRLYVTGFLSIQLLLGKPDANLFQPLRESTNAAAAVLIALAYSRIDQILIGEFFSPDLLGEYQLANRLVDPFLLASTALTTTIYSRTSRAIHSANITHALRRLAPTWILVTFGYSVAVVVGVGIAWSVVLRDYFSDYTALTDAFVWIALSALVFRCLNLCLTALIQASGDYSAILRINVRNLFVVLAGCLIGMYLFGAVGVAIGVVLGEALNSMQQGIALYRLSYASRSL